MLLGILWSCFLLVSGWLIGDGDIAVEVRQLLASFLQMALLSDDLISACVHDPSSSFANLLRDLNRFPDGLLIDLAKCVSKSLFLGRERKGIKMFVVT